MRADLVVHVINFAGFVVALQHSWSQGLKSLLRIPQPIKIYAIALRTLREKKLFDILNKGQSIFKVNIMTRITNDF